MKKSWEVGDNHEPIATNLLLQKCAADAWNHRRFGRYIRSLTGNLRRERGLGSEERLKFLDVLGRQTFHSSWYLISGII